MDIVIGRGLGEGEGKKGERRRGEERGGEREGREGGRRILTFPSSTTSNGVEK